MISLSIRAALFAWVLFACSSASCGERPARLDELSFAPDAKGKEICRAFRDALKPAITGSVKFSAQEQGSFVYNAPLADNNDSHPWHDLTAISDPSNELSKRYAVLEFSVDGRRWRDAKGRAFDSIRKWLENESIDFGGKRLCVVLKIGPEDMPFADKKTFREIDRLSEGRFIIACETKAR